MSRAATDGLLMEAARWRLLGLLFERPRPGWHEEVASLAAELGDERFEAAAREARDVDEGSYLAVLGPGGPVSPREVAYRPMGDPGRILAELNGFYEAFGYRPNAEDPVDHVAVEAGFVGFLKLKQAFAATDGSPQAARTVQDAVATFLDDHPALFAGELKRRLELAGLPHLLQAASILHEWCPGRRPSPLAIVGQQAAASPSDEDDPFGCGDFCG